MHSCTKLTPTESMLKIHESSDNIAVPPHQAHFLSSNQPLDSLDPLRDTYVHRRLCHGMAVLTSLQILKPIRYEQGRVAYCHQAPDTTRSSNAFSIPIVVSPFLLTACQGVVNPKSQRLSPDRRSALARGMLNARRTERLPSGDDRVEFVAN